MNESSPQQPAPTQSSGIATTSLVLGIIAFLSGITAILSIPAGIAAIIMGVMALKRKLNKTMAIIGIVTGSLGALTGLIVGALILMAVPALQNGQKDTQMKNDVMRASSAVNSYRTNNQGMLPSITEFNGSDFQDRYLDGVETQVDYYSGIDCAGRKDDLYYRLAVRLSDGQRYCVDQG